MLDLTLRSQCSSMSAPMACTSLTTKWRAFCCLMAIRTHSPSPEISTRKSQPCSENAQAERPRRLSFESQAAVATKHRVRGAEIVRGQDQGSDDGAGRQSGDM